jgi:adenylate cyclase
VANVKIQIYDKGQSVYNGSLNEPLELGRQQAHAERLFVRLSDFNPVRVAIAQLKESSISRRHVFLEPLPAGSLRVRNLSDTNPVQISGGGQIAPRESIELFVPVRLVLGTKTIDVEEEHEQRSSELQSLMQPTLLPGDLLAARAACSVNLFPSLADGETEKLLSWMQSVTAVLHSAAGSADFFERAAQCLVDLVHLDCGRVLLGEQNEWRVAAIYASPRFPRDASAWRSSQRILNEVRANKHTYWLDGDADIHEGASLASIEAVVAAPIFDRNGEVIGVLYGDRIEHDGSGFGPRISRLEAMLVEVLAGGVAAGLARIEQEKVALASQVRFEQFFTPELSQQLTAEPDLLRGRDSDVSVLFCDIRGFSRISERLGPARTVEWIHSVLSVLSDCVVEQSGVLVDYIGDELMAMWGAPLEQPDHAERACRAALAMHQALPQLSEQWMSVLGEEIRLGIGVNSGLARVGNTGSQRKFKYGPLGNTVNLASRVQGATKHLKADVLVTAATRQRFQTGLPMRRLCTVRVVNIQEPVDLYELRVSDEPTWQRLQQQYETALGQFEQQSFLLCIQSLGNILAEHSGDGPSLVLLSRAVDQLINPQSPFDPVWELATK